jgi:hypothetical protein
VPLQQLVPVPKQQPPEPVSEQVQAQIQPQLQVLQAPPSVKVESKPQEPQQAHQVVLQPMDPEDLQLHLE